MALRIFSILLVTALLALPVAAREPGPVEPDWLRDTWRWKPLGARVGLPTPGAQEIVHTGDGTAWARTALGVARFDGHVWTTVRGPDPIPAPITTLEPLGDHDVLVVAGGDLYVVGPDGARRVALRTVGVTGVVLDAVAAGRSDIVVLVDGRRDGRRLLRVEMADGAVRGGRALSPPPAAGLLRGLWHTRSHRWWLESDRGLYVRAEGAWSAFLRGEGLRVVALRDWSRESAVVAVEQPARLRGLWSWQGGEARPVEASRGTFVRALEVLGPGRAVAVLEGGTVLVRSGRGWIARAGQHSPLARARELRARSGRGLWVSGDDSLYWIDGAANPWESLELGPSSARNRVSALLARRDGTLWIGTADGLVVREADGATHAVPTIQERRLGEIQGLAEDAAGRMWVVARGTSGAWIREAGRWRHRLVDDAGGSPGRVVPGDGGSVWLVPGSYGEEGAGDGAWALRASKTDVQRWEVPPDGPRAVVFDVAEGPDGSVWLATGAGLSRHAGGRWRHLGTADGLLPAPVQRLALDGEGRLWFAHRGRGFGFLSPDGEVTYPDAGSGAGQAQVRDLEVGPDGRTLWLATADGLLHYGSGVWSHLERSTGLSDPDLRGVAVAGNRVFVGTSGSGVALLDLTRWPATEPRVVLERMEARDGVLEAGWEPLAAWGRMSSGALRTRYRLAGGPWSPWGFHRRVALELPGGDPRLEVQVAGPLAERGATASWDVRAGAGAGARPTALMVVALLGTVLALLLGVGWVERSRRRRIRRSSERRYLDLLQQAPDAIFTLDLDGRLLSINEVGERLLGRDGRQVRGRRLDELVSRGSALTARRMVLDALEGDARREYVLEVDADAGPAVLEVRTRQVEDDGVTVALQCIGREISARQRTSRILDELTVSLAALRGAAFCEALVEGLVRQLGVAHALVGILADSRGTRVRSVAAWTEQGRPEPVEYRLEGTPCGRVATGAVCVVERGVRDEYPDDDRLRELDAVGYVGRPLFDSRGRVLGLLAVVTGTPLQEPHVAKAILRAFSFRAAGELERIRDADESRAEAEVRRSA